jgi:hypothetical protein
MKPVALLSNSQHLCVSFVWPDDFRYFVGYRLVEHWPVSTPKPLSHHPIQVSQPPTPSANRLDRAPRWRSNWQSAYNDPEHPSKLVFQALVDGSARVIILENDDRQSRNWWFVPEENGVRIWMELSTHSTIPGAYIVQQCLRFSSGIGDGFRSAVATVPFLSELYMQALGNANGTMTWVRRGGEWHRLPVPFTRYHTTAGAGVYSDTGGVIDSCLIVRESASRGEAPASYWLSVAPDATWETWVAGLYWERTAFVSNRHPAGCLHAGVDYGPLRAGRVPQCSGQVLLD